MDQEEGVEVELKVERGGAVSCMEADSLQELFPVQCTYVQSIQIVHVSHPFVSVSSLSRDEMR